MIKIRCVVERITYQNPENGYSVLKCAVKNYNDLVTVVGNLVDVNVGSVLLIDGNWKVDAKYGRQFLAESWEETMPATVFGIEKYLGSGLIKGVGPKFARKIVQQFGTDTLEIIETDVKRLLEVPGIGKKRVDKITESWERQKEIKNVMLFLQDHGVSTAFAAKIYRQYGNESIQKVRENPFRLADDIWGIGFKTADSIAMKLGIGKEAFIRLRSGIMYTLSELADEGHVYAEREQLIRKASELLEAEYTSIIMTMDQMLKDEELIREKIMVPQFAPDEVVPEDAAKEVERECIYLPPFYYAEVGVANKLKKLSEEPAGDRLWISLMKARQKTGNSELSVDVEKIQKAVNMEYDQVQAEAIRRAATAKVLVLTGGPGTGKTTTTQGIIAAYRTFGLRILLAAPTGRAAKRMTEATGLEARTIHRLLEFKPPEGYQKNEETPLEGDVLIVDECSMIDIVLMNALMKAIPPHMRLILVGDIDQLPSVGAGNVLRDVIDSEVFPVVRLTRIFRQAQTSRIIMNAHKINAGEMPDTSNGKSTDFFFMTKEDPEDAARLIVDHDIPMVGVNLGTLGFLTEIELSKLYDGLDGLLNDTFQIEERMMLDGRVIHADHETDHLPALNDVVIARSGFSRIISFRIMVNGKLLDVYEADGIIVSTPTGSTGYNLSAGGPVVNPKANVILITPICPHSLQSNSLVLSPEDEIDIYIENVRESQLEEAYVTFDGQVARKLQPGDVLQVRKSKKIARIIKVKGDSFYRILRIKVGGQNEEK